MALVTGHERGRRTMRGDAVLEQRVDELRRREEVRLIRRQDVDTRIASARIPKLTLEVTASGGDRARRDRPRITVAALDGVLPHPIDSEQQRFAISRRRIDDGSVRRPRVVDLTAGTPST